MSHHFSQSESASQVPSLFHGHTYYPSMVTAGDDPFSRSVAALGYFDVWYAHAYATGIADVEITNVDEIQNTGLVPYPSQHPVALDWWNWSAPPDPPSHVPTFKALRHNDPLDDSQIDWQEPRMSSPAASNLTWLSPMSPPTSEIQNIYEASAQGTRRDPKRYVFISQSLCCKYLPRCMLQDSGPLPSHDQTQEYLCHELGLPPDSKISLALNEQLQTSSRGRTQTWCLNARVACILAIWGSKLKALETHEILQALIDHIPYCEQNSHHAFIQSAGAKRSGWAASVVYQLSRSGIFVLKTPEGKPCKQWRIDVRGADCIARRCSHIPRSR